MHTSCGANAPRRVGFKLYIFRQTSLHEQPAVGCEANVLTCFRPYDNCRASARPLPLGGAADCAPFLYRLILGVSLGSLRVIIPNQILICCSARGDQAHCSLWCRKLLAVLAFVNGRTPISCFMPKSAVERPQAVESELDIWHRGELARRRCQERSVRVPYAHVSP
jgi:hypothetical protein